MACSYWTAALLMAFEYADDAASAADSVSGAGVPYRIEDALRKVSKMYLEMEDFNLRYNRLGILIGSNTGNTFHSTLLCAIEDARRSRKRFRVLLIGNR